MINFDFDKPMLLENGEIPEGVNRLNDLLILAFRQSDDGIGFDKTIPWAISLSKDKCIKMDEADAEKLLTYIKDSKILMPLTKYRLKEVIKNTLDINK